MGSTEINIGLNDSKSSSRVLKPPGGGHSDIFGGSEVKPNPPRPKYNQQNSSNMNCVMGTADPDILANTSESHEPQKRHYSPTPAQDAASRAESFDKAEPNQGQGRQNRVPPGGFSSGFW